MCAEMQDFSGDLGDGMTNVSAAPQTGPSGAPPPCKLSIVMPVRNDGINVATIAKVVNALIETPHEILVVHDTPDDDCIEIVGQLQKAFDNISRIHNQRGRGVVNAITSGTEVARGEYIMILTADDIGPVVVLDRMVRIMDTG